MKEVYILTQGCYSDYRVVGVYDNLDDYNLAAKFVSPNEMLTMKLNEMPHKFPEGYFSYYVEMDENGNVYKNGFAHMDQLSGEHNNGWDLSNYNKKSKKCRITFYVLAKNEKQALKIANERRSILIAHNQFNITIEKYWEMYTSRQLVNFLKEKR